MSPLTLVLTALGGLLAGLGVAAGLLWRQQRRLTAARHEACHDVLTGLPNRRALLIHLLTALHHDEPVAMALLDIDRFKTVNDTLGHAAGDELLRQVADRLRHLPPPVRLAARLSGDEFAVVIAGDRDVALAAAIGVHQAVSGHPIRARGVWLDVSVSVGVATRRLGLDERHLLHHADQAMYMAKAAGGGVRADTPTTAATEVAHRPPVRRRDHHQ